MAQDRTSNSSELPRPRRSGPGRRHSAAPAAAAVLIALASAVVAVLAATGVLVAGCAHGCTAGQLVGEIGIAVLTFAAVGALGWLGVAAALRSGGRLGWWVLRIAVLVRGGGTRL